MKVKLIAYTPNPDKVCAIAAKNCVSQEIPEDVKDLNSLTHAMRAGHTSVAENASFTFSIEGVSRVLETQLVRHRIGASFAIQSGRYNARDPTNYVVPFDTAGLDDELIAEFNKALRNLDDHLQEKGIKAENRRYFYPQGAKTNIIMTMNGRELLHWLSLRLCARAQKEHRELAEKILELVKEVAPNIFSDAGPSCVQRGYCVEGKKSCGLRPTMKELLSSYEESHGRD